jgi:2-dehydropantoate 2-reductase
MSSTGRTGLSIVGAGSLGQTYAGLLAANGQAVTLLATPRTAERLLAAGVIRLRGAVSEDVPVAPAPATAGVVGLTTDPIDLPPGTGLLFTTRTHQLGEAIRLVRAAWPASDDEAAWVAGVQNGLAKDDLLLDGFGPQRVVGATVVVGAQREPSGEVTVTSRGPTYLGEFAGGASERVASTVEMLVAAGMPAESVPDIRNVTWSRICLNIGLSGVSVLTRASVQEIAANQDLARAFLAIFRETRAVATEAGVVFGDYGPVTARSYAELPEAEALALAAAKVAVVNRLHNGLRRYVLMTQDLLAGRPMEVEGIFGDIVERAERAGVAVPRLTLVRDLARGLHSGQEKAADRAMAAVSVD